MKGFKRQTICGACVVALAVFAPSAASAASSGPVFGYAISAVGFKSYFVFNTNAGAQAHGTLRLSSLTSGPKTILLSPVDVSTAANGGLEYGDGPARGEGRWLSLSAPIVKLAAGSADVPFTVTVPPGVSGGEHFLGIVALDRRVVDRPATGRGSIHLRLIPRLAMTVELRLPGVRSSDLQIGGARVEVAPSGASLAIAVANRGNALIPGSSGSVSVFQGSTRLFTQKVELASFVPGTAITYRVPWQGTPVEGTYRVSGEIRPTGKAPIRFERTVTFGGGAIQKFRQQTGRPAKSSSGAPVLLIAALAAVSAIAVAFGVAYGQARRKIARTG
jgi:hypothetical protein